LALLDAAAAPELLLLTFSEFLLLLLLLPAAGATGSLLGVSVKFRCISNCLAVLLAALEVDDCVLLLLLFGLLAGRDATVPTGMSMVAFGKLATAVAEALYSCRANWRQQQQV
jgi:hypothetical protein